MIAYVARALDTGRTLSAHDDVQLPAYSTIKVLLAAAFWRMAVAGELDEAQPYSFEPGSCVGGSGVLRGLRHAAELSLADVMHLALVVSDNDATNIIAEVVGLERVDELAAELGLTQTRMQRLMMDQAGVPPGARTSPRPTTWLACWRSWRAPGRSVPSSASALSPRWSCRSTSTGSPAICRRRRATRASAATTPRRAGSPTTARSCPPGRTGRRWW